MHPPAPEPCRDCYYAKGVVDYCDGTCKRLPMSEWKYFVNLPDEPPEESRHGEH